MIKKFIVASLLTSICFNAQSVGINTEKPNESAALHIAPFQGEMAKITANISGGRVTGFNIINPGSGYTQAPEVFISGGGPSIKANGVRATATATVRDGKIASINLTNGGNGYETTPSVTLMRPSGNLGWLMPRVDLQSITNGTTPVNIIDNEGDGVLVYNQSNNDLTNTTYWYDTDRQQWNEGITTDKTPRMNVYSFTQDMELRNMTVRGGVDNAGFINHRPFEEPISNLPGVEFLPEVLYPGNYYLSLPKIPATYIIEVSLNFTTERGTTDYDFSSSSVCTNNSNNCSKPFSPDGYHIMGYFLEANYRKDAYNLVTARNRKEMPVISKIGNIHTATWNYVIKVDPNYNTANQMSLPFIRFVLGRMDGSTYYNNPKLLKEGSFIKVQQVR